MEVLPDDGLAAYVGWTGNSLLVSGLAASACAVLALPVAFVMSGGRARGASRRTRRGALAVGTLAQAGYALPGVIVALAIVAMSTRYADPLYGTLPLLIFAYVVRFLPQAMGACRTSLLQTNPKTEEAARGLGHAALPVLGRITLPQMLPGLSAGGLLVFLTVMKELPATLLLSPIGFDTLATQIWSSTNEALFAGAAVPAMLLVLISAVPTVFLVWRERDLS